MTVNHYEKIVEVLVAELNRKETEIILLKLKLEEAQKGEADNG